MCGEQIESIPRILWMVTGVFVANFRLEKKCSCATQRRRSPSDTAGRWAVQRRHHRTARGFALQVNRFVFLLISVSYDLRQTRGRCCVADQL